LASDSEKSIKRTQKLKEQENEILPAYGGEVTLDSLVKEETENIRQDVKLNDLEGVSSHFKFTLDNNENSIKLIGASGMETAQVNKLKVMTDPYTHQTRKEMIECAYTDAILSPSFERRKDAQFEDGFYLDLELKMTRDPNTDALLTPEQSKMLLDAERPKFLAVLNRLRQWTDSKNLEEIMDEFTVHEIDQGRCVAFFFPGILELTELSSNDILGQQPKRLPSTLEIVPVEDLKEPIVDTSTGNRVVGVNTDWPLADHEDRKRIIRKDEMVYGVRRNWMLRKDSRFYGSSTLEPVLVISKALKRMYNFDIPDAVVASYIAKIIFKFQNPRVSSADITNMITSYLKSGKKAFGTNQQIDVMPVTNKVDTAAIQALEKILTDTIGAVLGVPKSMLNREHNLNRDIATIEAIQFIKFVRKPDERHVSKVFEDQLLNPLFAYLLGQDMDKIPVKVVIKPNKTIDEILDNLMEQKQEEINRGAVQQPASTSVFGAASEDPKKKLSVSLGEELSQKFQELKTNALKN